MTWQEEVTPEEQRRRNRQYMQAWRRLRRGSYVEPMVIAIGLSPEYQAVVEEFAGENVFTVEQWTQNGNYTQGWGGRNR